MVTKSRIILFLIALLLCAQLALAQHATVHFTDHGHEIHHEHDDGTPQTGELCQICIFAKGFNHTLMPEGIAVRAGMTDSGFSFPVAQNHLTRQASQGYLARGPPAFLI